MFDPSVGRWNTPDPIGFDGGDPNLYRYVGNQPTGYTDPSGLDRFPRGVPGEPLATTLFFNPADYPAGVSPWVTTPFIESDHPPETYYVLCAAGEGSQQAPKGKEEINQARAREQEPLRRPGPQSTLAGSREEREAVAEGTETFMVGATLIMMAPFFGAGALAEGAYLLGRGATVGGRVLVDAGKFYAPYVRALPKVGAEMVVPGSTGALGLGSPLLSNPGYTPHWLRNQLTSKPGLGLSPGRGLDPFRGLDLFRGRRGVLPLDPEPFPDGSLEPGSLKGNTPWRIRRYNFDTLDDEIGRVLAVPPAHPAGGNRPYSRPELVGPPVSSGLQSQIPSLGGGGASHPASPGGASSPGLFNLPPGPNPKAYRLEDGVPGFNGLKNPMAYPNMATKGQIKRELEIAKRLNVNPIEVQETGTGQADPETVKRLAKELGGKPALYVVTTGGRMYIIPKEVNGEQLTHSMASKGSDVVAAGQVQISPNGKILKFDNGSGHYRPDEKQTKIIVDSIVFGAGLR